MIYQVKASLFFDDKIHAASALTSLSGAIRKAVVVHPDEPTQEGSSIEFIKCYHDETPTKPCERIGILQSPPP